MHDCHYLFFNHKFKFQNSICKICHDLTLKVNINNFPVTVNITVEEITIVLLKILANLKINSLKVSVLNDS